jgi:phosphoribosylanthranilate isomerase
MRVTPCCWAQKRDRPEFLSQQSALHHPTRAADYRSNAPFVTTVGVFVNHAIPRIWRIFALSLGLHAVQLHERAGLLDDQRVKVIKSLRVDANFRVDVLRTFGAHTSPRRLLTRSIQVRENRLIGIRYSAPMHLVRSLLP